MGLASKIEELKQSPLSEEIVMSVINWLRQRGWRFWLWGVISAMIVGGFFYLLFAQNIEYKGRAVYIFNIDSSGYVVTWNRPVSVLMTSYGQFALESTGEG